MSAHHVSLDSSSDLNAHPPFSSWFDGWNWAPHLHCHVEQLCAKNDPLGIAAAVGFVARHWHPVRPEDAAAVVQALIAGKGTPTSHATHWAQQLSHPDRARLCERLTAEVARAAPRACTDEIATFGARDAWQSVCFVLATHVPQSPIRLEAVRAALIAYDSAMVSYATQLQDLDQQAAQDPDHAWRRVVHQVDPTLWWGLPGAP